MSIESMILSLYSSLYPWRAKGNTHSVLQSPGVLTLCPTLTTKIVAELKIRETAASLFFSTDNRSKVIFQVTQKSLRILLIYFRKHLALAGGSAPNSLLPMVTWLSWLGSNPELYRPMVAFVSDRPSVYKHSEYSHHSKAKCYGE